MKLAKIGNTYVVTFKNGCSFATTNLSNAIKVVFGQPLRVAR